MALPRIGSLQIAEDLDFERRVWRAQRIGWVAMGLVVVAGLAGLFGSGPLSRTTRVLPDRTLAVEYDRFARRQAPTDLKVIFSADAIQGGELRVWLDRRYAEEAKIEQVVPQPQKVEVGPERLTYVFAAERRPGAFAVTFHLEFLNIGLLESRLGFAGRELRLRQFIFP